jgi:hypothetical protein
MAAAGGDQRLPQLPARESPETFSLDAGNDDNYTWPIPWQIKTAVTLRP